MNTTIAKANSGFTYIDFKGNHPSKPVYMVINNEGKVFSTYNRKLSGMVTRGMKLANQVNDVISRKREDGRSVIIEHAHCLSAMDALKKVTNACYSGTIAENSTCVE